MPLRFLSAVAIIHLFPIANEKYFKIDYFSKAYTRLPTWGEFGIFLVLCILALYFADSPPSEAEYNTNEDVNSKNNSKKQCSSSALYTNRGLKMGTLQKHYNRQLRYDIAVYLIPMICIGMAVPIARNLVDFLLVFCTFYMPIYNHLIVRYFLKVRKRGRIYMYTFH